MQRSPCVLWTVHLLGHIALNNLSKFGCPDGITGGGHTWLIWPDLLNNLFPQTALPLPWVDKIFTSIKQLKSFFSLKL